MNKAMVEITVEIMGKPYQIKCPESEANILQKSAQLLEDQMRTMRETNHILSSDKIIIAAALNIAHQLLILENQTLVQAETFQQQLQTINIKLDTALEGAINC